MKKRESAIGRVLLLAGVALAMDSLAYTPVAPPDWNDEPGRVRHLFLFPGDSMTPAPDESDNLFGSASAVVHLGAYAAGWQDPDPTLDVPESAGEPGNGAWDLGKGPAGEIRITVPVGNASANPGFTAYRVHLLVNVVGYELTMQLPALSADGYWLAGRTQTDTLAFPDPVLGEWRNRTWTATLLNVTDDQVTLIVSADSVLGSTIDAIEIYAWAEEVSEVTCTAMGVPIAWYQSFGFAPAAGDGWNEVDLYDFDGDGALNWQEYAAGTDPTDPASLLRIVTMRAKNGEPLYLEWIGGTLGPTNAYIVESTRDLKSPDWQPVGTRERVEGLNDWTGPEALVEDRRFFRIKATQNRECTP